MAFTDITSRHIEGKRLDKTVWNLLNFYAFVKNHVKVKNPFKRDSIIAVNILCLYSASNRPLEDSYKEG